MLELPPPINEPNLGYAPGSPERAALRAELERMQDRQIEIPCVIGGEQVQTGDTFAAVMPHRHAHVLGNVHRASAAGVRSAIAAAKSAWPEWSRTPWQDRASIFLRAAELLAGPWRPTLNAATMLNQSKTAHQAEIDSACELIDFWRLNVHFLDRIYREQPRSAPATWNRMEYRPLEGFVLAITPFNFTSIAGNLPTSPAMAGNAVVWKPASSAALSAHYIMALLREAGLPDGVINLVHGSGPTVSGTAVADEDFAGLHFTGSTAVFQGIWRAVGERIAGYRNYPRLIGETGGKDFIVAHASADLGALATAIVRGSFEYQGQKCSASSRLYIPSNLWPQLRERLVEEVGSIRMGDVGDFRNFMGAVIDEAAFRNHTQALEETKESPDMEIVVGGGSDGSVGWFVEPTVIRAHDPMVRHMREELFGPIVTAFVYDERRWPETLDLVDGSTPYGLTGSVFATERKAIAEAEQRLRHAAGNFYVNDKPTGAIVDQQPFGGARASGTNDKAGSLWNMIRWVSPRAIKENLVAPTDYRYAFMAPDEPEGTT